MKEYLVIYEKGDTGWGAYCPDLPGLGVAGDTKEEVEQLIREAIPFHIAGLKKGGDAVPEPASEAERVAVAA